MLARQRCVVHRHGDHRDARLVHDPLDGHARREVIHRPSDELVGAALDAGHRQHVAQVDAGPFRVADEVPADEVRDTRDRHVLLDDRERHELGVAERYLVVHEALDRELPAVPVDGGRDECLVDPVEVGIRDDDRRQPARREIGGGQVGPGREGRRDGRRRGVMGCRGGTLLLEQEPADDPGDDRPDRDGAACLQQRAAAPLGHASGAPAGHGRAGGSDVGDGHEPAEQPDADDRLDARGTRAERHARVRLTEGGGESRRREAHEHRCGEVRSLRRQPPQRGPDPEPDDHDEELEHELVGGAEYVDDELLHARGLVVDEELGDGEEGRGNSGKQARQELADRERRADSDRTGERQADAGAGPRSSGRPFRAEPSSAHVTSLGQGR